MNYEKFLQPKEIGIGERTFAISKIPAIDAQTIYSEVAKSISANGIIGITMLPIAIVKAILKYSAICEDGNFLSLETDDRINRTFTNNRDLQELVIHMVKENFDFLITGDLLDLLVDKEEATESAS